MVRVTDGMRFAREVALRAVFMDGGSFVDVASPEALFRALSTGRAKAFLNQIVHQGQPHGATPTIVLRPYRSRPAGIMSRR